MISNSEGSYRISLSDSLRKCSRSATEVGGPLTRLFFACYRVVISFVPVQTDDADDISSVSSCDSDGGNVPFDWNVISSNRSKFESFIEQRRREEEQVNYMCCSYRVHVRTQHLYPQLILQVCIILLSVGSYGEGWAGAGSYICCVVLLK